MAFTIHGLDKELDERLTERARHERTSKNQLVKRLLARAMGLESGNPAPDDYGEFLGRWTKDDVDEFERRQSDNGRVDKADRQ